MTSARRSSCAGLCHSGQKIENRTPDKFAGKRSCRILIFTRGRTTQKGMTVRPRRDPARRLHISARTQFDLCLHPLPFLAASRATHSAPARRRPRLCTWNHTPDDLLSAGHFSPRPHSEGDSRLIALASEFSWAHARRDDYRPIDVAESPLTPANAICTCMTLSVCRYPRARNAGSPPTRSHANASLKSARARVRLRRAPSGDLGQAQTRICAVCTSFVHP